MESAYIGKWGSSDEHHSITTYVIEIQYDLGNVGSRKKAAARTTFSRAKGMLSGHRESSDHDGRRFFENCYSPLSNPGRCQVWYLELSAWVCGKSSLGFVSLAGLRFYLLAFRFSFYSGARCRSHLTQFYQVGRNVRLNESRLRADVLVKLGPGLFA